MIDPKDSDFSDVQDDITFDLELTKPPPPPNPPVPEPPKLELDLPELRTKTPVKTPAVVPLPPVVKKPEWKVLEPTDRTDEVPHTQIDTKRLKSGWKIAGASIRGKLHAHKAMWREDSFASRTIDDWTLLAVSDGAGSAKWSRIASRFACENALTKLQELLIGWVPSVAEGQPSDADLHRLRCFMGRAGEEARRSIIAEAHRRNCETKEFYATLLVVAHVPWAGRELVVVLQVGDGAVGVLTDEKCHRLGISDHGEYSSETRFLTTPNIELEFENRVVFSIPQRVKAIAVMSDGVSDDFYPEDQRIPELFNADPIPSIVTSDGTPVRGVMHSVPQSSDPGASVLEWLRYEKRGSSDDRTLLLMYRS